ncbi:MAG: Hsp20/alpha crystallin family protein [Thermodesulfovibrionales bacterium]|jgi:HSP20 family protein
MVDMSLKEVLYFHPETAGYQPAVDLYETDDSLVFEIDLPGINTADVLIKVYDDIVIIEGVKRESREEKTFNYLCVERKFCGFRRMLKIPIPVNSMEGKASYSEGVITVTFPKLRDKVIKIKVEI